MKILTGSNTQKTGRFLKPNIVLEFIDCNCCQGVISYNKELLNMRKYEKKKHY